VGGGGGGGGEKEKREIQYIFTNKKRKKTQELRKRTGKKVIRKLFHHLRKKKSGERVRVVSNLALRGKKVGKRGSEQVGRLKLKAPNLPGGWERGGGKQKREKKRQLTK